MRLISGLKPAAMQVAPTLLALLTAAAGVMLLASGATPTDPDRFAVVLQYAPIILIEISHFLSSILGLVLVLLAFGLRQRLGAAWAAVLVTAAVSAVLAVAKGFAYEEAIALGLLCLALLPFREAFPRTARLSRMEISPGWLISAFAALVGVGLVGVWSFQHVDYGDQDWWKVMGDSEASRAIRSSVAAGVLLLVIGLWRLLATPATPKVFGDQDPDFDRVRAVLANAEVAPPEANLALLGDKRFLFSESGCSFLMFGVRGRSWIALGAPVGRRSEQDELIWRFRELADAHAARPGFYAIGPELLPAMVEMGFVIQKTGESAVVDLATFSMQGRKREVLRRNWRKACETGVTFEVLPVGGACPVMDELKRVSDEWLSHHAGGEKGFSMGGFLPRYLAEFPLAVVRKDGAIVAFANLWPTPDRRAFSMDLMRYSREAPKNVMDYLFVELLQWGRAEGFQTFEFGMAPLAGLQDRPLAPLFSRLGRLLFERGEDLYNFQGVRRYKDKYDPEWRPRYVAGPSKWGLPILLADMGLLSSGGVSGLAKRPRREVEAPPAPAIAEAA